MTNLILLWAFPRSIVGINPLHFWLSSHAYIDVLSKFLLKSPPFGKISMVPSYHSFDYSPGFYNWPCAVHASHSIIHGHMVVLASCSYSLLDQRQKSFSQSSLMRGFSDPDSFISSVIKNYIDVELILNVTHCRNISFSFVYLFQTNFEQSRINVAKKAEKETARVSEQL